MARRLMKSRGRVTSRTKKALGGRVKIIALPPFLERGRRVLGFLLRVDLRV